MRDYKELYREIQNDMPRIYVDIDVLCDFVLKTKNQQLMKKLRLTKTETIKYEKLLGKYALD